MKSNETDSFKTAKPLFIGSIPIAASKHLSHSQTLTACLSNSTNSMILSCSRKCTASTSPEVLDQDHVALDCAA